MRVCFFVLGTCYKVLSHYSSHLAQTVILFFFKCLCVCVCVCVCLCVRDSTCVCTHRYACVKQDIGFSKRRNGFLWTEHYLNSNTVKCYKKPYSTVKPMRIQRRIVARFGLTTSIFSDDLDCCRIHTSKNTCTHHTFGQICMYGFVPLHKYTNIMHKCTDTHIFYIMI